VSKLSGELYHLLRKQKTKRYLPYKIGKLVYYQEEETKKKNTTKPTNIKNLQHALRFLQLNSEKKKAVGAEVVIN